MLKIVPFVLGPVSTNTYLIADSQSREAVVVDPAWDGEVLVAAAGDRGWQITQIWLTHAHFDHFAGGAAIAERVSPTPEVGLHPEDLPLWKKQGGAPFFGLQIDSGPEPTLHFQDRARLPLGEYVFEVRHAPGHTRGHVMFYCSEEKVLFCGDVVFRGSIGRTDLPGGDYMTLIQSIQTQVLSLPDQTRLLSGHGPETTVGLERRTNPFLI